MNQAQVFICACFGAAVVAVIWAVCSMPWGPSYGAPTIRASLLGSPRTKRKSKPRAQPKVRQKRGK
jgi:hypothetical protein